MTRGSRKYRFSLSDGVATLRDAILLILSSGISYLGDQWFGGLPVDLQAALVVVVFAVLKAGWKYVSNTERVEAL